MEIKYVRFRAKMEGGWSRWGWGQVVADGGIMRVNGEGDVGIPTRIIWGPSDDFDVLPARMNNKYCALEIIEE